ncbi:hypothetical protein RBB50_009938, partial [Rhinocladiella similis]
MATSKLERGPTEVQDSTSFNQQKNVATDTASSPQTPPETHQTDIEKTGDAKSPVRESPDGGLTAWLVVLGAW